MALTGSPISMRRTRTASNTSPSSSRPRVMWSAMAAVPWSARPTTRGQRHEANADVQVDEQIDVTVIGVFTSGDAAKDAHVARAPRRATISMRARRCRRRRRPSRVSGSPSCWPGSFDQLGAGTKTRFAPVGFIRADHRLRHRRVKQDQSATVELDGGGEGIRGFGDPGWCRRSAFALGEHGLQSSEVHACRTSVNRWPHRRYGRFTRLSVE